MSKTNQLYIAPQIITMPWATNGLAIISKHFNDEKSNQTNTEILERMVANGLKLNFSETLVIQLKNKEIIKLPKNIQNVFLFGVHPKQISLNVENIHNKVIRIGHLSFIFADDLLSMQNNIPKKNAFWSEVKKIYNV